MPELRPRGIVLRTKEYHPPLSGRTGLRLDFNENTDTCSPRVLAALRSITGDQLTRYPERQPVEAEVAAHLALAFDQVLLTNGVDEAIHLICETYLDEDSEVVIIVPTFGMYEIYAQQTGARVISIQADPDADFAFPLAEVRAAMTGRTKLVCIASPNNPTGKTVSTDTLRQLALDNPQAAFLIDEAYYHFHGETLLPELGSPNLFVVRTFSKAYGLAGLRVGVLCGSPEQMRFVRKISSPYNVNEVALTCLSVALCDQDSVTDYAAQILEGRADLERYLTQRKIRFWKSDANFVLLHLGDDRTSFIREMRDRGILVRAPNSDPGCAGCVRITIGTGPQMQRLFSALDQLLPAPEVVAR
ncbi:MAG: histidinol-phosphate transaminase [Acidobacteriaceae bacterium]